MRGGLILGEVAQGLRRNLSMVVAVVLVTFISLTFLGAAILVQFQIGQTKGYWYDRAQVTVYFCTKVSPTPSCANTDATPEQIAAVKAQLDGTTLAPYIKQYTFEDHQQAYANFQQQFSGSAVTQIASPDILSEAFRINMVDPAQANVIIDTVTGAPGVESVEDQRGLLEPIFAIMNAATYTAIGIAALMIVAALLLIATTIRLSAFSRRREVGIMRLVGASNRFIQTPFILEGVIAALIGSVLAGGAVVLIVRVFVDGYLSQALPGTALVGMRDAAVVVPILLATGIALAAISASVSIRRYLKV